MNQSREEAYRERFIEYIEQHLDEALSVEQLSQIAHFSKFHFHRQFSDYGGISVIRYIQLMRLKRASYQLVFSTDRITEIALNAVFENPESFSRAFKYTFGQTPSEFRKQPKWHPWSERYQFPTRDRKMNIEVNINNFKQTKIAVLEHRGAPTLVNDSVKIFIDWRKSSGLSPVKTSQSLGSRWARDFDQTKLKMITGHKDPRSLDRYINANRGDIALIAAKMAEVQKVKAAG